MLLLLHLQVISNITKIKIRFAEKLEVKLPLKPRLNVRLSFVEFLDELKRNKTIVTKPLRLFVSETSGGNAAVRRWQLLGFVTIVCCNELSDRLQ